MYISATYMKRIEQTSRFSTISRQQPEGDSIQHPLPDERGQMEYKQA